MKLKIATVLIFMSSLYSVFAQEPEKTGRIDGRVIDMETRHPISGVNIRIIDTKYGAVSDKNGNYSIKNLPIGRYKAAASILGYSAQSIQDIIVVTKRTAVVNFELMTQVYNQEEIVIRPENFQTEKDGNMISTSSISYQELRISPGMPDLFKRMQLLPGISGSSESSSALIVRGGDPEENLTLVENVEIASPFHFSSMSGTLVNGSTSIFEPKLIENVNLSTGGFSVLYGDKMSAVTNISLREPSKNKFNADLSLDLSGASAFVSTPISDNLSLTLAGRRGVLDLLLEMMDETFTSRTTDFHAKLLYEPSINHKLSFYALYADDQIKGSNEDDFGEDLYYTDLKKQQYAMGLNWRWLFAESAFLTFTPYINVSNWQMETGKQFNKDAFVDENNEKVFGGKANLFYKLSNFDKINIGFDIKSLNADYLKSADLDTLSNGEIVAPYYINYSAKSTFKTALYAEYQKTVSNWLDMSFGLRHDYFEYIAKSTINPRFTANIQLSNDLKLNAAVGLFSQFPQFYKIYLDKENKKLKPSEAVHLISGIDYLLSDYSQLKIEAFYKDFNYLPVVLNDTSKIYKSTGKGKAYGIEFSFIQQMYNNLYLMCNYTYSTSERKDTVGDNFYNFKYDKPHSLNIMLTYRIGDWWELGLTAAYSSGAPYTPPDLSTRREIAGVWYCDNGARNSARYPDYFRIDFRAERRFVFQSWNLRAYLDLWNLTNNENIFEYNWNKDFTKKKGQVLYPFMPIIGIAAEL